MNNKGIKVTNRVCIECGRDYKAREMQILGMSNPMIFGGGRCSECARVKMDTEEAREKAMRELEQNNRREHWRGSCGIPRRFINVRFGNFKDRGIKSLIRSFNNCVEYADKFPMRGYHGYNSLVLYSVGVWGVGKTHLVSSIAHRILDRWAGDTEYCPVKFVSEPNLFIRIRNTFNRHQSEEYQETEADIYRQLTTVPLLIIDDIGKEEVGDPRFVQRVLFTIINGRYDNMLPVIITANLDTDMLERHFGGDRGNSATFDRLAEMTGNIFREIQATSYRDFNNR